MTIDVEVEADGRVALPGYTTGARLRLIVEQLDDTLATHDPIPLIRRRLAEHPELARTSVEIDAQLLCDRGVDFRR